jgi:hypothetical protein
VSHVTHVSHVKEVLSFVARGGWLHTATRLPDATAAPCSTVLRAGYLNHRMFRVMFVTTSFLIMLKLAVAIALFATAFAVPINTLAPPPPAPPSGGCGLDLWATCGVSVIACIPSCDTIVDCVKCMGTAFPTCCPCIVALAPKLNLTCNALPLDQGDSQSYSPPLRLTHRLPQSPSSPKSSAASWPPTAAATTA